MMTYNFDNYNDFYMKQFHPYITSDGMTIGMGSYYNFPYNNSIYDTGNRYYKNRQCDSRLYFNQSSKSINRQSIPSESKSFSGDTSSEDSDQSDNTQKITGNLLASGGLINSSSSTYYKKKFYSPKKHLRKCSYVIAVIKTEKFINLGGTEIYNGIYIINKKYSESEGNHHSAVIGIHKKYVQQLTDPESEIYKILSESKELSLISGIKDLYPYKLDALKYLLKFTSLIYDKELLLFTIEPKGEKKLEKIYPRANLCLCGGGLEPIDGQCYERCARREFLEETGITIPQFGDDAKLITKQKFTFSDRQAMHFIIRIN